MVVSPDVGGVARARAFAKKLNDAPLAIVDKRRSAHNISEVMNLIGDVRDKVAVLVDDMIDTAGARLTALACIPCVHLLCHEPPDLKQMHQGLGVLAHMLVRACRPKSLHLLCA